jgi:hypothetical protein
MQVTILLLILIALLVTAIAGIVAAADLEEDEDG